MTVRRDVQSTLSCGPNLRDHQLAPLEVITQDILYLLVNYFSVEDLASLGVVSKSLRASLGDRGIWKKFYRRTTTILPPGPYDWQSTSYLVNALIRAEKLHAMWPSSSRCPLILHTRTLTLGCDAVLAVLLGRWLLVANGSVLVCYDSHGRGTLESPVTLFDEGTGRRILHVCSVGGAQEHGIVALIVLLFQDSFTVAKVFMDRGKPCAIQTVFTSAALIDVDARWADFIDVRLYHRLLVVNSTSGSKMSGFPVIMDIDTLRQYHIAPLTDDPVFGSDRIDVFLFATKTHLVKVIESGRNGNIRSKLECFPIPTADGTPESDSDILPRSHQSPVVDGARLRQCTLVHESPIHAETGEMTFVLCGLYEHPEGSLFKIKEVCLKPDGNISFEPEFQLANHSVTSFCVGFGGRIQCGVAFGTDEWPLVFAFGLQKPGSFFMYCVLYPNRFPGSELVFSDSFDGVVFFSRRSSRHTFVEVVDFVGDAEKVQGQVMWKSG